MLRSDNFSEGRENVIRLPEDDATGFGVLAEYLYVGEECDTGAVYRDFRGESRPESESDMKTPAADDDDRDDDMAENDGNYADSDDEGEEEEIDAAMEDDKRMVNDFYDFTLQFSCYVLADKLQARGFKRHIMAEIRGHGEFCDSADLTVDHIRYAYDNTISQTDPLRRFCVAFRCRQTPIEKALDDPDFIDLMQDGGPLVRDVMQMSRRLALKQKQGMEKRLQHRDQQIVTLQKQLGEKCRSYERAVKIHENRLRDCTRKIAKYEGLSKFRVQVILMDLVICI